jgi:single-strand DNA-binding protein
MAVAADMAKRPSVILAHTGSQKTATEQKETTSGGFIMSVNKSIVVGNLGRDPEIRTLPSGQSVANFSVATKARFKDRNGETQERTEWHRVVAFGKLADTSQRLLTKGRLVYIEGRLATRQYQAKDGSGTRYHTEIVVQQLRLLGSRTHGTATPQAEASDDIPF